MKMLENLRDKVRKHNDKAQERQDKAFDQGKREVQFVAGQEVWRKSHHPSKAAKGINAKLREKLEGSYKISQVVSPTLYLLDLEGKSQRLPLVHVNQLRGYVPRKARWVAPKGRQHGHGRASLAIAHEKEGGKRKVVSCSRSL